MQLIIRGHGIHTTPALREYADKKFRRLEKFFSNIQRMEIHLDAQRVHDLDHKQAVRVTVALPGGQLHAEKDGADMYALIDIVYGKVMLAIRRYKDKHFEKKRKATLRRRTPSAYAQL
jgi:putative sigma-54 modulation protein